MMSDDEVLVEAKESVTATRDALAALHMDRPAGTLIASGRARRARRLRWGAGGVAALAAVAVLGLTLPSGGTAGAPRQVHVNLADWSVNTNPNGTVSFTVREVSDPARLQRALAQAGVPAIVRYGEFCVPRAGSAVNTIGIVIPPKILKIRTPSGSLRPIKMSGPFLWTSVPVIAGSPWTIVPSKIPAGTRFVISEVTPGHASPHRLNGEWLLAHDVPVSCSPVGPPN